MAEWLVDLRTSISGRTRDYLADQTVKRRAATVSEFYRWAHTAGLVERAPTAHGSRRAAQIKLTHSKRNPQLALPGTNTDPHPIDGSRLEKICHALGSLPSGIAERWTPDPAVQGSLHTNTPGRRGLTSRDRLAFELALTCGMRVDEIANLPAAIFEGFECDDEEAFRLFVLEITHTKGLVPREVFIPYWLMSEIAEYVAKERAVALQIAGRLWAKGEHADGLPWQLLVNPPGSGRHVGKAATPDTIEHHFNATMRTLEIDRKRIRAKGTGQARVDKVVSHTFHDLRHTFAVMMFRALEDIGIARPWLRIQTLLGHANISTTVGTYLRVLDDFGPEILERLSRTFSAMRDRFRAEAAETIH